jgi:ribosome-binding protein aMBF1 (putative translation factor)
MRRILDPEKLAKLKSFDQHLDERYGAEGSPQRQAFHERAMASYYADILRDRRKELKLTQQQLASRIGKERSYIAHIERGETDMQMSSFTTMAQALGIRVALSYV